jgi:hypothetical protein
MAQRSTEASRIALATVRAPRRVAEEILARIERSDDPAAMVQGLGPLDLLTALREADDERRVDLLVCAAPEQIVGVIDLACWRGDAFDAEALGELLAPAVASGMDAAARLYDALDGELRTLLLKPYVVVHLREDKNEEIGPLDERSEFFECADGYYGIELPNPEDVPQVVRQLLAALLNLQFAEYQPELECLRHDFPSGLEEAALRWRTGRLADLGFASHEEGQAAIAPLDPETVRARLASGRRAPPPGGVVLPALHRECLGGHAFLDAALARAAGSDDPELSERAALLPATIGAAVNRFLSGVGVAQGDLEAVASGVRLARDTLALGLGAIAGHDVDAAARALLVEPPISFLRVGMGILAPLRDRARSLKKRLGVATGGRPLAALDPPHGAIVEALAADVPRRFPPLDGGADLSPAPLSPLEGELVGFAEAAEVSRAAALLAEAEGATDLLARLGVLCGGATAPLATPSVALLTALANAASGRSLRCTPLTAAEAAAFAERALRIDAETLLADALRAVAEPLGIDAEGPTRPAEEPDPRRRLVVRSLILGRARIEGGPAHGALVVERP